MRLTRSVLPLSHASENRRSPSRQVSSRRTESRPAAPGTKRTPTLPVASTMTSGVVIAYVTVEVSVVRRPRSEESYDPGKAKS